MNATPGWYQVTDPDDGDTEDVYLDQDGHVWSGDGFTGPDTLGTALAIGRARPLHGYHERMPVGWVPRPHLRPGMYRNARDLTLGLGLILLGNALLLLGVILLTRGK